MGINNITKKKKICIDINEFKLNSHNYYAVTTFISISLQIPCAFKEPVFKKYTNCSTLNTNVKMYFRKVTS